MRDSVFTAVAIVTCAAQSAFCWPTVFPAGTTLYDPSRAYDGYTLFTPMAWDNQFVYLINMNGELVHQWKLSSRPLNARLLPDGNLLVVGSDPTPSPGRPGLVPFWMGGAAGILQEVDWEGKEVFRHNDLNMHHDALKLPNGNYMYLAWERVPTALLEKVRGGIKGTEFRNVSPTDKPANAEDFERLEKVMFNDVLVEIDPRHEVVWSWNANKHLDPDVDILGLVNDREEWCHTNTINLLQNGNVLLTCRQTDSILVVDKRTRKVIFRWGSMSRLNTETGELEQMGKPFDPSRKVNTLSGPHDAEEVPPGIPGAGHITVYDNGVVSRGSVRESRAVELDPAKGDVVWSSTTFVDGMPVPFGRPHFSEFLGSAQKLPNGNMLLCEGMNGRFYQLTQDRKLVWEYVNPYVPNPRVNGAVQKAHCYAPDFCPQFKTLKPAKGPAVSAAVLAAADEKGPLWLGSLEAARMAVAAAVLAALVSFVVGWKWGGRRAARALLVNRKKEVIR